MTPEGISVLSSVVSAIVAIASFALASMVYRHSRRIAEMEDGRQSAALQLQQRQLIVPLWEYLSKTEAIAPENPNERAVVDSVNVLELVALCYESQAIEQAMIKRTFRDKYLSIYREIEALPKMGSGKSGRDYIHENRACQAFYDVLSAESKHQDKADALPGG